MLSVKIYKIDKRFYASILDLIKQKIRNAMHNTGFWVCFKTSDFAKWKNIMLRKLIFWAWNFITHFRKAVTWSAINLKVLSHDIEILTWLKPILSDFLNENIFPVRKILYSKYFERVWLERLTIWWFFQAAFIILDAQVEFRIKELKNPEIKREELNSGILQKVFISEFIVIRARFFLIFVEKKPYGTQLYISCLSHYIWDHRHYISEKIWRIFKAFTFCGNRCGLCRRLLLSKPYPPADPCRNNVCHMVGSRDYFYHTHRDCGFQAGSWSSGTDRNCPYRDRGDCY